MSVKTVKGILEACIARESFTGYYDDWIGEEYMFYRDEKEWGEDF